MKEKKQPEREAKTPFPFPIEIMPSIETETELKTKIFTPVGKTARRKTYSVDENGKLRLVEQELPFSEQFTEDLTTANLDKVELYLVKELLSIGQLLQMISLQSGLDLGESVEFAKNLAFTHLNASKSKDGFIPWITVTERQIAQTRQEITQSEQKGKQGWSFFRKREGR